MVININRRTNQRISIAAIIQILLLLTSIVVTVGKIRTSIATFQVVTSAIALINILLFLYMFLASVILGEKRYIGKALLIYLAFDIIRNIDNITLGRLFGFRYTFAFGILILLVTIYLFIATLLIKSPYVAFAFKLFGTSILVLALAKIIVTITLPLIADNFSFDPGNPFLVQHAVDWLEVLSLVMPVSVLLIVKGVNNFIKVQNGG